MQTIEVSDDIVFAYTDSGLPPKDDYLTVIVLHGHTFHSGTFRRMTDAARGLGYRLIVPNRRLYPGSTPYTPTEIAALQPGTSLEIYTHTLEQQGLYLLEFVDGVTQVHGLENVAVAGWSSGALFLTLIAGAIAQVPEEVRSRLKVHVRALILWDPASVMHGFAMPSTGDWQTPLFDERLSPAARIHTFTEWVTGYFPHPALESRRFESIILAPVPNPPRVRTMKDATPEEFAGMVDLSAADRGDSSVGDETFWPTTRALTQRILFRKEVRNLWGARASFAMIYGEASVVNVIWAVWQIEAMGEKSGMPMKVKKIPGANHFPMIDDILSLFEAINSCVED
ncbi:hypothetical protein HYPSUDRAFT_219627 [Hypholoma sublateritium FD-334 SS-4]|uniref:AB hydrolase-1 domain-containing protein n=1 Tax=Hypholoma sublateritium (strain FD-334 SS-4) TaxID=945553 RepID=A0A0D2NHM4_HYPSF|nr:hypothetical protein HYPSUDRAFT_219627 [Hypholoma sublateritium FD-334 SS-4]